MTIIYNLIAPAACLAAGFLIGFLVFKEQSSISSCPYCRNAHEKQAHDYLRHPGNRPGARRSEDL